MPPVTAIIVGAGHRAICYASYAEHHPDELQIVGVADPLEYRRRETAERFGFGADRCFTTAQELAAAGKLADTVINGTMDQDHVHTSLPLLEAGYDILLEKPFAVSKDEVRQLSQAVKKHKRQVMICHVLRYAPFYAAIRQKVAEGAIGTIMNIQAVEHVSYHHMVVGYVRGKWNREAACGSTMLMAKSCHDLDLITWMKSGIAPVRVASFGERMFFRQEQAPEKAGTFCLVDCPIEASCTYSARKMFLDHPYRWAFYVWDKLEHLGETTIEQKEAFLKQTDHNWGRCVWKCDNDVVDHQSVAIDFADGATATLNMIGNTARPTRTIHLIGTEGEIEGCIDDEAFTIRRPDPRPGQNHSEERIDLGNLGDTTGAFGGHGGGDLRLVGDFVRTVRGEETSLSCTSLADSINGHMIGFLADESRRQHRVMTLNMD